MAEIQNTETPHERRITWSLMAAVFVFVLLMTCIVLWITSALIREELGGARQSSPISTASPSEPPASVTPLPPTATQTIDLNMPILVDATWTPIPGLGKYVKFVYWYVKPNRIHVGECIQLTWETKNAVSLQLYRNGKLLFENVPPAKTLQDCPKQPGYTVYRLVGTSPSGETNWIQLQVKVDEAP